MMLRFLSIAVLLGAAFLSCGNANAQQSGAWRDDDAVWPKGSSAPSGLPPSVRSYALSRTTAGDNFERYFVEQPIPRKIVFYGGKANESNVTSTGAFRGNANESGSFSVESQRNAYWLIAAGVVADGSERNSLLDKGLKSLEWTFDRQGADGSFPNGGKTDSVRILHPRSVFLSAAARSLSLLRQSADVDQSFKNRAEALVPKLQRSATWVANSRYLGPFFEQKQNTNQHFFIVLAIHEAGLLANDQALLQRARSLMSVALARQGADGTFPEARGFDFSYQTVSLELLARYTSTIVDGSYRAQLSAALQKGIDRMLRNIASDGTITTDGSTRTMPCNRPIAGPGPKGKDVDIVPFRLYYFGYLLGRLDALAPLADKIEIKGQGFDHVEQCGGEKNKHEDKDKSESSRKKKH